MQRRSNLNASVSGISLNAEEPMSSRSFRYLQRSLKSETCLNERLVEQLRNKDDELIALYQELTGGKSNITNIRTPDVKPDVKAIDKQIGDLQKEIDSALNDIKTALTIEKTVDAYDLVSQQGNNVNFSLTSEKAFVIHKIIALRNSLTETQRETEDLKERTKSLEKQPKAKSSIRLFPIAIPRSKSHTDANNNTEELKSLKEKLQRAQTSEADRNDIAKKLEDSIQVNIKIKAEQHKLGKDYAAKLKELKSSNKETDDLQKKNKALDKQFDELKTKLKHLQERLTELEEENKEHRKESKKNAKASMKAAGKSQTLEVAGGPSKIPSTLKLQLEMPRVKAENMSLHDQIDELTKGKREIQLELEEVSAENEALINEIESHKNQSEGLFNALNSAKDSSAKLNTNLEQMEKEKNDLLAELASLKTEQVILHTNLDHASEISRELDAYKADRIELIQKAETETNAKIVGLKDEFKRGLQNVVASLKDNGSLTSMDSAGESTGSDGPELGEYDISLATKVVNLVDKIADDIFADGVLDLDVKTEVDFVKKDGPTHFPSSLRITGSGGRNFLDFMGALQRGIDEMKTAKQQKPAYSGKKKRKYEVVDEMQFLLDSFKKEYMPAGDSKNVKN